MGTHKLWVFLLFSCLSLSVAQYTLSDQQIAAGKSVSLNGPWQATSPSQNLKMTGTVPGDITTDLFNAGIIPDPIRDVNFIANGSVWAKFEWNYTTTFTLSSADISSLSTSGADIILVFDGIKMGADILINGKQVDTSISQFLRLNISLRGFQQSFNSLVAGGNQLSVIFDPSINVQGLFAQCSGGWDWAPYTGLKAADGNTEFSIGIWKDVYLVWVPWLAITDTVIHTYYTGPYPTQALAAGRHSPFLVQITLYTYNPGAATSATANIQPSWGTGAAIQSTVTVPAGFGVVTLNSVNASADQIDLWWPSGYGPQALYNVEVGLSNQGNTTFVADSRKIGFRYATMVTGNDTDPNYVNNNQNTDGSDSFGLMWRINGQAIFNRGANVIPMDNLEGRYSAAAHRQMVLSARDGMMNTLRIWGGGIYQPQVFYDTCDEVGILVLQDLMNRGSWQGIFEEEMAYRHQARRLSHHASIIVWNGCNECEGKNGIVPNTVAVLASEDTSRSIWPSCPSSGWKTGVNRLTGYPDGNPLSLAPGNGIETHGPYQHGDGWPAVNGDFANLDPFNPDTPPQQYPSNVIGLGQPNQFTSEFGSATWSSFESVSATLSPMYWSLHGGVPADKCTGSWANDCTGNNPLAQRNYPCDSIYASYYGTKALTELDEVGPAAFQKQLYKCVLGSSLKVKSYIEETRSRNCFGSLVWQLNEIWPTGGWGSLEYGSSNAVSGQVTGGRWKPVHYWMRKSLFTDILIGCGVNGQLGSFLWCYVKNDSPTAVEGALNFQAVEYADAQNVVSIYANSTFNLAAGPNTLQWFKVAIPASVSPASNLLLADYVDPSTNQSLSTNVFLLAPPSSISGLSPFTITTSVDSTINPDQSVNVYLTKSSDAVALFVTLTTLADGRFSDNAFSLLSTNTTIQFIFFSSPNITLLQSSLRVEHLGNYL